MFDELDLDKLEAALNNSITEPSASAEKSDNASTSQPRGAGTESAAVHAADKAEQVAVPAASGAQPNDAADAPKPVAREVKGKKAIKDRKANHGKKAEENAPMSLYDWVQCLVYALVAGVLIFIFIGRAINIEGASMYPTLHNGDEVIISNLFYSPKAGDVVVLRTLSYGPKPLVKRIIATEGQTVDIDFEAGVVYVDGTALKEDYVNAPIYFRDSFVGPVTVPEGCIFVLGDNRNESSDSRHESIGMVDERCIIGRVVCVLLPAYGSDGERDWSRIGEVA